MSEFAFNHADPDSKAWVIYPALMGWTYIQLGKPSDGHDALETEARRIFGPRSFVYIGRQQGAIDASEYMELLQSDLAKSSVS